MTILDRILENKYKEVEELKSLIPVQQLEKRKGFQRQTISLKESLTRDGSSGIIAEFKRMSPSKGVINRSVRVEDVVSGYINAGVAGLSILTDRNYFGGSPADIVAVRDNTALPILRKDFIVDEYQIIEARAMGADVILLIAAALETDVIKRLAVFAKSLNLEILFEIHTREELEKIAGEVDMIGINNRNLKDFKVDLQYSMELARQIPEKFPKVSESGIDNVETIKMLRNEGFHGFLIGENFMKAENPGAACNEFIKSI